MMSQHRSFQAQRAGAAGRAPATKGTPSGSPRAEDKLLVLLEKPLYGRRDLVHRRRPSLPGSPRVHLSELSPEGPTSSKPPRSSTRRAAVAAQPVGRTCRGDGRPPPQR